VGPAKASLELLDAAAELKALAVVDYDGHTPTDVKIDLWDTRYGRQLGTITIPPSGDGNLLASWPTLTLVNGDTIHLTPGYFSGEKSGSVYIEVE
jgi:hypothetical protein